MPNSKPGVPGDAQVDNGIRVGHLISLLERVQRRAYTEALREFDLSLQQFAALFMLSAHSDLSNAALARRSFMTPQSANEMIRVLVHRGLVIKTPSPTNRKTIHLNVSAPGRRLLKRADTAILQVEATMLSQLSPDCRSGFQESLILCLQGLGAGIPET